MTTFVLIILIVIYIIGGFVAFRMMKDWPHGIDEKIVFAIIWPLVLVLYGIHYLHNKE